jgi:hypothetical protein
VRTDENEPYEGDGSTRLRKNSRSRARVHRLRKNSCFVSGHDFRRALNPRLMTASNGVGIRENRIGSDALYPHLPAAQVHPGLTVCVRIDENEPYEGDGSTRLRKKPRSRARVHRLRKTSCFVSEHDFSRAVNARLMMALAAEVRLFNPVSATKNRVISLLAP